MLSSYHIVEKKKFTFRGCGWKPVNTSSWSKEKKEWILTIDQLFCDLFGSDFLSYKYNKDKGTGVVESTFTSLVEYDHDQWERNYMPLDEDMEEELSSQWQIGCPTNQNGKTNEQKKGV